jgi:deoxyribodipyrimidine photo-lyase
MYENGLFLFHRDLRLTDNTGFIQASSQCKNLYTCFIFTPEQISAKNEYRSIHAIQFMLESLEDLSTQLKSKGGNLVLLYGNTTNMIGQWIEKREIDAVFFNRDFTPYAMKRDEEIAGLCQKRKIDCIQASNDYYLYEPGTIRNVGKGYYKKFTAFYNHVVHLHVAAPNTRYSNKLAVIRGSMENQVSLEEMVSKTIGESSTELVVIGGRKKGLQELKRAVQNQSNYGENRDVFSYRTSCLSAYLKFGCLSIREVYHMFHKQHPVYRDFIRELIWRDFFAHLLFGFPQSLTDTYGPFAWSNKTDHLNAWKQGKTGFPIVDAAMRELNQTGYMHNRGRMTVAHFLIKVLLIDWKKGEQYFASKLTDYDPASNNGNWAAIYGRGIYNSPYFRVMNPWIQSSKFDRDCVYIKKWVPELKEVENRDIHRWDTMCISDKYKGIDYPKPIVDYGKQKKRFIELYEKK